MCTDDASLLSAWYAGDAAAGEALFERYFPALFRFFRAKVDEGIDDLVQRTMTGCVAGRDRLVAATSFRAYLFGVARHVLHEHLRALKRARAIDPSSTSLADLAPSPSAWLGGRRELRLLGTALRRIPIDLQIVLELHYWERMTTNELATVLELPVGTVRGRLQRARTRLREQMQRLEENGDRLRTTWANLDAWAEDLRRRLDAP